MGSSDILSAIVERKRRENERRQRHVAARGLELVTGRPEARGALAAERLRRAGSDLPRVIAEIKLRSPSAGEIRARRPGAVAEIAAGYVAGGAAAVSVLCDGPGFGGTPLDLRRASRATEAPLLFKEFVLCPLQVELARAMGAHMVLLLVGVLSHDELTTLVDAVLEHGMAPVVEAADDAELDVALATRATIVGVNARDLRTFQVDPERAARAIERIPGDRIAVHMSGIKSAAALVEVGRGRADAALVGEGLMRADDPGARLRSWLGEASGG